MDVGPTQGHIVPSNTVEAEYGGSWKNLIECSGNPIDVDHLKRHRAVSGGRQRKADVKRPTTHNHHEIERVRQVTSCNVGVDDESCRIGGVQS